MTKHWTDSTDDPLLNEVLRYAHLVTSWVDGVITADTTLASAELAGLKKAVQKVEDSRPCRRCDMPHKPSEECCSGCLKTARFRRGVERAWNT